MKDKIANLIGLAIKSGKLISGEDTCKRDVQANRVVLVIVAMDASDNTKKLFNDKCSFRKIPIRFFGTKEDIGIWIGKMPRAVIAIKDKGFSAKLMEYIDLYADSKNFGGE